MTLPAIGGGSVRAATAIFYVDGKTGSDTNAGTSLGAAFKTVKAGMWATRYGGRLEVVGYDDYVYYETQTASQWFIGGTSSSPVVVEAYGYGTTGYVRPIVSGALVVSRAGQGRWTRPNATTYPDVWATPFSTAIPGYESAVNTYLQERIFVDTSIPLRRPKAVSSLADLEVTPGSQYWNGSTLYVRLGGWGSPTGSTLDPNAHTVEVPYYKGLLVASGSAYVQIHGFRIRHTTMGVGFTGSSHDNTVEDTDASYDYGMGFFTASTHNTFRRITGTRNTIQLVKLDDGAQYNLVDHATATENLGQGIKLTGANNAYNTVQYSTFANGRSVPAAAAQYGGYVQGIDIEQGAHNNTIARNTITNNRRGLMLYELNSLGKPLAGNVISYNLFSSNDSAVVIWDGRYSAAAGAGAVSFYRNTYSRNTTTVTTESTTSNKSFNHETIYRTGTLKAVSDSAFYLKAGAIKLVNSIVYGSAGYAFYVKSGARLDVSYTTVYGYNLGARTGNVVYGTAVKFTDPKFLSVDQTSANWLAIDGSSPVYRSGTSAMPLGARWH